MCHARVQEARLHLIHNENSVYAELETDQWRTELITQNTHLHLNCSASRKWLHQSDRQSDELGECVACFLLVMFQRLVLFRTL